MQLRTFGRIGWNVSEVGYGMWGMGSWSGSNDDESMASLERAVDLGCNFFDTAWAYGQGHSERLLGRLLRARPDARLYCASKMPPKNMKWPATAEMRLEDTYPADHIRELAEKSLENVGVSTLDLLQFHTWSDAWADDARWQRAIESLKAEKLVRAVGISVNRWEPENGLRALRTGLIDAVQVVYNIFDQAPEDELFPVCRELGVAVIARVPFDEGTLTGNLKLDSSWPQGDFRNLYFAGEKLKDSVEHAERLRPEIPVGMTMPELALRFILANPDVATIIPGMRKSANVDANLGVSDGAPLGAERMQRLRRHRWDRGVPSRGRMGA
jgi:aryl-alcohol dehydrogenase-like predicted oxidoreductase